MSVRLCVFFTSKRYPCPSTSKTIRAPADSTILLTEREKTHEVTTQRHRKTLTTLICSTQSRKCDVMPSSSIRQARRTDYVKERKQRNRHEQAGWDSPGQYDPSSYANKTHIFLMMTQNGITAVCVLSPSALILPVDIEHNQCTRRSLNPREIQNM